MKDVFSPRLTYVQECFELQWCAGVIGGRPNHALYLIGYMEDQVVYLDPHTTQPAGVAVGRKETDEEVQADARFHTRRPATMEMARLDPSLALVSALAKNTREPIQGFILRLQSFGKIPRWFLRFVVEYLVIPFYRLL